MSDFGTFQVINRPSRGGGGGGGHVIKVHRFRYISQISTRTYYKVIMYFYSPSNLQVKVIETESSKILH